MSSQIFIDFKPAEIHDTPSSTVIVFYVKNPSTGILERQRIRLNHIHDKRERLKFGRMQVQLISRRLCEVYRSSGSYTKTILLLTRGLRQPVPLIFIRQSNNGEILSCNLTYTPQLCAQDKRYRLAVQAEMAGGTVLQMDKAAFQSHVILRQHPDLFNWSLRLNINHSKIFFGH